MSSISRKVYHYYYLYLISSFSMIARVMSATCQEYTGSYHFDEPAILHDMKLNVHPVTDKYEFVLSNRKTSHYSMDIAKGESRKWHGLVVDGWTPLVNFWLDTPEEKATPKQVVNSDVYPQKIHHDIRFNHGKSYSEEFWMLREKDAAVIRYKPNFSGQAYFRPVFGFRKDWDSEANRVDVEYDGCTLFATTYQPKRPYKGPKWFGIRILQYTQFRKQEEYPGRSYWRDQYRNDVGTYRYVYEAGRIQTTVHEHIPFFVLMAWGQDKDAVDKELNELQHGMADSLKKTTDTLAQVLSRAGIESSDSNFTRAIRWSYASLDSLTMNVNGEGIYAGIPWFNQYWGRDTFISFPGTLLTTSRSELAQDFIMNMAFSQDKNPQSKTYGRVPNILQPLGSSFSNNYETTDGTGWWIRSIWMYFNYNGLEEDFLSKVWPHVEVALDGALKRTDENGFLTHEPRETWMDAMFDNKIITPRNNRAVEIQALHFTALDIGSRLANALGLTQKANIYKTAMLKLKSNFLKTFWNEIDQDLFDHLTPQGYANKQKRPNMIYVITVPLEDNSLIDEVKARKVLDSVIRHNVASHGVRSLAPNDPEYRGKHDGTGEHHDYSYHNGDVWPFLSGPVIEASIRLGEKKAANLLTSSFVKRCLTKDTLGAIEEILDGIDPDPLGHSRGAYSQAWSMAEFVRTAHQNWVGIRPNFVEKDLRTVHVDLEMPDHIHTLKSNLYSQFGHLTFERFKTSEGLKQHVYVHGFKDLPMVLHVVYRSVQAQKECSSSPVFVMEEPEQNISDKEKIDESRIEMKQTDRGMNVYEYLYEIPQESNFVSFTIKDNC